MIFVFSDNDGSKILNSNVFASLWSVSMLRNPLVQSVIEFNVLDRFRAILLRNLNDL